MFFVQIEIAIGIEIVLAVEVSFEVPFLFDPDFDFDLDFDLDCPAPSIFPEMAENCIKGVSFQLSASRWFQNKNQDRRRDTNQKRLGH
jgi:hypothetical protein